MRFSSLLTKNVISLYNGTNEGIVISGSFDEKLKKLNALEIVNQNDTNLSDEYILKIKCIYNIGEDAITIKNNSCLELKLVSETEEFSPINSYSYSTNGKLLGKVTDIEFDDKFNISKFILDSQEIVAEKMASFSKGTIIFYDDNCKVRVEKFKPSQARIKVNDASKLSNIPKAYIMPTIYSDEANENTIKEDNSPIPKMIDKNANTSFNQPINSRIERLSTNLNLLIGKKITKTISTANGELIAKKGNLVTSKTIYLATAHQKLRELVLYCE